MLSSSKVFLETTNNVNPEIAIILGSGLTNFFKEQNIIQITPPVEAMKNVTYRCNNKIYKLKKHQE